MADTPVAGTEPWMRGTHLGLDPLRRGVIHALELAQEDAQRWASSLTESQLFAEPCGLPPVAFHLRHIVRSLDRLLSYAEGQTLDPTQLDALATEHAVVPAQLVWEEFAAGLSTALRRVRAIDLETYAAPRGIGRLRLPTTVGGLLLHCADHTQRHAGQMVTTAKLACVL